MSIENYEKWISIAESKGWDVCSYIIGGPICRGCHEEIYGVGYDEDAWESPKGGCYHSICAIKRLKKETRIDPSPVRKKC